ncbi:MAG: hypothetical protein ACKOPM_05340 [Novosphingobium sp.]
MNAYIGVSYGGYAMSRILVATVASGVLLLAHPASASDYFLDVVAATSQQSTFSSGQELIADPLPETLIMILEPRPSSSKQASFAIGVVNRGGRSFNFGPENVTIRLVDGTVIAMLDYNELMRRQKKREGWQRFAMGFAAGSRGAAASQAGYTTGTATYSGTTNGYYGTTPYNAYSQGTATYSGYDSGKAYAAQAQANAQNAQDAETMRARQESERARIAEVMQTTTVYPGQLFTGIVQFDIPKSLRSKKASVPVVIEVRSGGEVHKFDATFTKR